MEVTRSHAEHGVRKAVYPKGLPYDIGITDETPLPAFVTQDSERTRA
jgi:hypothetical protein